MTVREKIPQMTWGGGRENYKCLEGSRDNEKALVDNIQQAHQNIVRSIIKEGKDGQITYNFRQLLEK